MSMQTYETNDTYSHLRLKCPDCPVCPEFYMTRVAGKQNNYNMYVYSGPPWPGMARRGWPAMLGHCTLERTPPHSFMAGTSDTFRAFRSISLAPRHLRAHGRRDICPVVGTLSRIVRVNIGRMRQARAFWRGTVPICPGAGTRTPGAGGARTGACRAPSGRRARPPIAATCARIATTAGNGHRIVPAMRRSNDGARPGAPFVASLRAFYGARTARAKKKGAETIPAPFHPART